MNSLFASDMQSAIKELQRRLDFEANENVRLRGMLQKKDEEISSLSGLLQEAKAVEKEASIQTRQLQEQLASEKEKRELTERMLGKASRLGLLVEQLDEEETDELMYLEQDYLNKRLAGADGETEGPTDQARGELVQKARDEFLEQEAFYSQALQDQQDIIANYEEQIRLQEEELNELEVSGQKLFAMKEDELRALADQVKLLQDEKGTLEAALEMKDAEVRAVREILRCTGGEPEKDVAEALKESIDAKVEEIAHLRAVVDDLRDKMEELRRAKEFVQDKNREQIHQNDSEIKNIQDQAATAIKEMEMGLEDFKVATMEELSLKEDEIEFLREKVVALEEITRAAECELRELKRQKTESAVGKEAQSSSEEDQEGERGQQQREETVKERLVGLMGEINQAGPLPDQKEDFISAMREFTQGTAANCIASIQEKEARIAALEELAARAMRDCKELGHKLMEKQAELDIFKIKAREELLLKEEENESIRRTIVILESELKRETDDGVGSSEESVNQGQHSDDNGGEESQETNEVIDVPKATEADLLNQLDWAEHTVLRKEAVIAEMKKFVGETAANFQSVLEEKDSRIAELEDLFERQSVTLKELENELAASQKLAQELRDKLSAFELEQSSLKESREAFETSLQEMKEERDILQRNLATRERESDKMEENLRSMEERITQLTEEKSRSDKLLEEALIRYEGIQKRNNELEENVAIKQEVIGVYESQLGQLKSAVQSLESQRDATEKETQSLTAELGVLKRLCSEQEESAQKYRTRMKGAKKEIKRLVQSLETANKAVDLTKNELEQCRAALSKSVALVEEEKQKYADAVRRQGKATSHNQVLEARLRGMEKLLAGKERKVDSLREQVETEKQNRVTVERQMKEMSERLERESKKNENFGSVLQKISEGLEKMKNENTGITMLIKDGTSRLQAQIDNFQRALDDKGKLLLNLAEQKEERLRELKKFQSDEQSNVKQITEDFLNTLVQDKAALAEKLKSLESENRGLLEERAELQGLLKSMDFTVSRFEDEISTLRQLVSDKEGKLSEALEKDEALSLENQELKLHLKDIEGMLLQETAAKNELSQEVEQMKAQLEKEMSYLEEQLAQKDERSRKSQEDIENLRCQVQELTGLLEDVSKRFDDERRLALRLREENEKLEASNKSLRQGNEVYQNALKDMDLQAVTLKTTQGKSLGSPPKKRLLCMAVP